jgi:hypothetical protein
MNTASSVQSATISSISPAIGALAWCSKISCGVRVTLELTNRAGLAVLIILLAVQTELTCRGFSGLATYRCTTHHLGPRSRPRRAVPNVAGALHRVHRLLYRQQDGWRRVARGREGRPQGEGAQVIGYASREVCAMQNATTVLGVLRDRDRKGLPCNELYRQMFNRDLYLLAYGGSTPTTAP